MMTKQEFELIEETIRLLPSFDVRDYSHSLGNLEVCLWDAVVSRFAEALGAAYPRFNKDRFVAGCHGRGDV
jgi:hypothetical protein